VQTDFENLQNFTLWFVSIKNNSANTNEQLKEVNTELEPLEAKYKELLKQDKVLAMGKENEERRKELQEKKKTLEQAQSSSS
jgi:TolA-binding protein